MPAGEKWIRFAPYGPLIALIVQVVWLLVLFLFLLFLVGDKPMNSNRTEERLFEMIGVIPAAVGLFVGILCLVQQWARTVMQWAFLLLGTLICAIIVGGFVHAIFE